MTQNKKIAVFPGWKVVRKLGEGSFGSVYEIARMLPDGREERGALKRLSVPQDREEIAVLRAQSFSREQITTHFKEQMEELVNEYTFMQQLSGCPTIVSCQDVRCIPQENGIGWDIFIRMELLKPLKKAVNPQYHERQVLRLGMDMCRALMACEEENIIHRDIKPENILVSENGRYKLGDFGIAKVSEKTQTGTMAGTNGYMAPEVANRQQYGREVDIYSLGMVLYWMMNNNTLPFLPMPPEIPTAEQRQRAVERRLDGEPLPSPCNGSEALKRVVLKACAYRPEDRFRSAREFGSALQWIFKNVKATDADGILQEIGISQQMLDAAPGTSVRGSEKQQTPSISGKEPQKKKGKFRGLAAALAVALLAGSAGAWVLVSRDAPKPQPQATQAAMASETGVQVQVTEAIQPLPALPYAYERCGDGIRITGWQEKDVVQAVIPAEIEGLPVVEIGPEAFRDCSRLTAVTIAEEVTLIGQRAFSGCTALQQVCIPAGVKAIEEGAFEHCRKLTAAEFPQTLLSLGRRAFYGCTQLNDITLPEGLVQLGDEVFRNCESLSGIDIPESVVEIGDGAFLDSLMLTAIVPASFQEDVLRFMPESCEITYSGLEKPDIDGEVGDIILFGRYEQDNDLSNGSEPIEWQILEKNGTKIYVISKYGLDSQRYHDKWEVVCWETCKLRIWLNQTFYTSAFNAVEQSMIVTTDVRSVHPTGSYPSKTVQDNVFLLDYSGAYGYFKSEKARTCIATEYAHAQGSTVEYGNRSWWWLREGYFVDLASIPNTARRNFTDGGGTVRPMICIETGS